MKTKAPPGRRKFANTWDQIGYFYDKLLYWLYEREQATKARGYAERLGRLLLKADPGQEAIFGQECWSLIHESKGDLRRAIKHRKNEIRLIRRLHEITRNAPNPDFALQGYGYDDLSDRLDLLAMLYYDSGNAEKAISTLQESQRLCKKHGIKFDGSDLLEQYADEKGRLGLNSEKHPPTSAKRTAP